SAIDFTSDFRATINRFSKAVPIEDIIKTLRAGKSSSLAIMSKDGLNSELYNKLRQVAQKVREGNLTIVLKVWEQEIEVIICFIS
ncbi:hypothetical protein PPACK8108_LOCUS11716, partial [Phakopsora pachyrhizi]